MIEIHFSHKIEQRILSVNILSIGHGLPQHGQLDFISMITEYVDLENGQVVNAYHRWGFGWWRVVNLWNNKKKYFF